MACVFLTIGVLLTLVILNEHRLLQNFKGVIQFIEAVVRIEMATSPVSGICLILVLETLIYQCFLPLVGLFNLLVVYLLQNPILSFFIIFVGCFGNSFLTYFLVRKFFKTKFDNELAKSKVMSTVLDKFKGNDWKIFFLIKLLTLPATLKNIVLGTLDIKNHVLVIGNAMFYGALTFKFCLIGSEIRQIEDIFSNPKGWKSRNKFQKLGFIVLTGVIIFNVFFASYITYSIKKFIDEQKKQEDGDDVLAELGKHVDEEDAEDLIAGEDDGEQDFV
jgi:uncharacterized membrane protein YdjX (TVP38/TMEM64 family)